MGYASGMAKDPAVRVYHSNYACLDLTRPFCPYRGNHDVNHDCGSQATFCHTLLHFVTLFHMFLPKDPAVYACTQGGEIYFTQ